MVRQHGSLEKDAETNQAAWEAAKGAAWGGTKVSADRVHITHFCSWYYAFKL